MFITVDSNQVKVFDGKFKENNRYWNGDMTINTDAKGLTYTTTALTEDMEVTGHPVVHLWLAQIKRMGISLSSWRRLMTQENRRWSRTA
jgi:predicted acyl esterase